MKKIVVGKMMNLIENNGQYSDEKLAEIKYGLEGLYLTLSKLVVIILIAYLFGILKEVLIFLIIYNIIRTTSFGLHATKSWICLLSSTIIFIGFPIICKYISIDNNLKLIIGLILILFIYKNAPADTYKRPIVSKNRRLFFKYLSTFIAIAFVYCSILISNNFISNCFILSLLVQSLMVSPTVYKIFNLPYNNYITYLANNNI